MCPSLKKTRLSKKIQGFREKTKRTKKKTSRGQIKKIRTTDTTKRK